MAGLYKLGSYVGTPTPETDMIPVLGAGKGSANSTGFTIRKIAICGTEGMRITVNDAEIELTESGIFETNTDAVEIKRLIFHSAEKVNIRYLY